MTTIHHFQLENRSLAYCWSHGPAQNPIVVLHGLGDSAIHTYMPIFANTALKHSPALFIDLPGFGYGTATESYPGGIEHLATDVLALLEDLRLREIPLFGHSMGGNIAIAMVHQLQPVASHLIVAEPLLDPAHSVLSVGIARQSEGTFVQRGFQLLTRATRLQAARGDMAAAAFSATLQLADPTSMYRAARSLVEPRNPDFLQILSKIRCPRDLIVGERARTATFGVEDLGIRVHCIMNAGHSMFVEQSERSACAILDIVR